MYKFILIFMITFIGLNLYNTQEIKDLCQTNDVMTVRNAFKLNDTVVVFAIINGKSYPIKLKDFKLNAKNKSTSVGSVEVWNDWNIATNGTKIDKLQDIHSLFRFSLPDKRSPLIFAVTDSDRKKLIGYEVEYNSDVTKIESIKSFDINPYESTLPEDVLNLNSLFANFPDDYSLYAKPVVSFPINDDNLPKRALLYYYETDPNNTSPIKYRVHIMIDTIENKTINVWKHDFESGECIDLDENNIIDSAIAISDYSVMNKTHKSFEIIEFYENGNFEIKRIIIEKTKLSDTHWEVMIKSNIKAFVCHGFDIPSEPLTTPDSSQTIQDLASDVTEISTSKSSSDKKSLMWIFVLIVIVVVIVCGVCFFYCFFKKRSGVIEVYEEREVDRLVGEPQIVSSRPFPEGGIHSETRDQNIVPTASSEPQHKRSSSEPSALSKTTTDQSVEPTASSEHQLKRSASAPSAVGSTLGDDKSTLSAESV